MNRWQGELLHRLAIEILVEYERNMIGNTPTFENKEPISSTEERQD